MRCTIVRALAACAVTSLFAGGPTGRDGQICGYPETRVAYGTEPRPGFSFQAVTLGEDVFGAGGGAPKEVDFAKTAADAAFAYDESNLYVALTTHGVAAAGEVILRADGKLVRTPIGGTAGDRVAVSWTRFGGVPAGAVSCALDLAWPGLTREKMLALPQPIRRLPLHTSFSALTDAPEFSLRAHLPRPQQWGRVVFGAGAEARQVLETPAYAGAKRLGAPRATPTVDGDLSDWTDEAFATASLLGEALRERYAVRLATAFDAANLYVAAYFSHPDGRPVNTATAETGAGYGGGDALQLRLSPDGKESRSFCAWLSPSGPALTKDTQDPKARNVLAQGGRLAFGTWTGGYTMELAIPWEAIGAAPREADTWRMTFQPWWNAASDRFTFLASLAFDRPPAKTVACTAPRAGVVSLGVYDAQGRLVRTLVTCDGRSSGELREPWNLKDQFGAFVAPGDYQLRGIVTDGVRCEYRHTLGNPGTPAWPTPDGRGDWLSDEAPPQAVATDGETVFVAAPGSEKGFATMAIDGRGRRLWGVCEPFFPRCVSLSYLDGRLYALYSGPIAAKSAAEEWNRTHGVKTKAQSLGRAVLVAYDAKTGRRVGFSEKNARTELGERWAYREKCRPLWELIQSKEFAPENYIGQPRYFDVDVGETDNAIGFAALPGIFVVSKHEDNRLEFYDAATLRLLGKVALAQPAGLCRLNGRTVLAISGRALVKVTWDAAAKQADVTPLEGFAGLRAPVALAVDAEGTVYVSDWRDRMQVRTFTADGRPRGDIGKEGGRAWVGRFDHGGMLLPHGLAVTRDGRLFVAEADMCPKRLSCWEAKTGRFLRHWLGPTPYGGMSNFWIDPKDPGFYHTGGCKFAYDPKTGGGDIVATEFRRMSGDQPFMPNGASCMGTGVKVVHNEHGEFLCMGSRNLTVWMRKQGDVYVPCAALGGLHYMATDDGTGIVQWDSDIGRHLYRNWRPECFRGHAGRRGCGGDNFAWHDANGDGLVQAGEMRWHETLDRGGTYSPGVQYEYYNGWGAQFAADGTAHFASFAKDYDMIMKVKPRGWSANGPVYDIGDATPIHREPVEGGPAYSGVYTTDGGDVYAMGCVGNEQRMSTRVAITSYDGAGRMRWELASSETAGKHDFAASGVNGEWNMPGLGRVLCTWNWWWNFRPYFFTEDGLLVGTFGEETTLGPAALWSESGTYYFQRADGTPFLVNGANQAHHVFEVKGLANARRFAGTVRVTAADVAKAKADAALPVKRAPPPPVVALDGTPVRVDGGRGRGFTISATLDAAEETLHLVAEVDDPTPMLQRGTDYRTLFITGDCVDFMFAADPKAPEARRAPAFGDRRLLFSEMEGRPVAVLFEPVMRPRAAKPHQLMAAQIDRITVLDEAKVKIVRRAVGYTLTADVPLAALGLESPLPPTLLGDVGVVFSDAVGGRELRLYRYNKQTHMTADLSTEATLQPAEWGRMLVPLGKNLVADPSFEDGSAWERALVPDGDRVVCSDVAHTGRKSLLVETRGHVSVGQTVQLPPNAGGRRARLRLFMRSEGLKPETGRGKARAGAWAAVWVFVKDAQGKTLKTQWAYSKTQDSWKWEAARRREEDPGPRDLIDVDLPEGADAIRLDLKITARGLDAPVRVWFDSVEMVLLDGVGN